MVRLEEVEDETFLDKPESSKYDTLLEADADYTDTDSEISEDDLPNTSDLPDETLGERIAALKDIIPPETRAKLSNVIARTSSATGSVVVWGGKALWVVTTSVLLLGLPYALVFGEEQMMMEQERQERAMTEGQSGMLGGAQGQGQAKAAL